LVGGSDQDYRQWKGKAGDLVNRRLEFFNTIYQLKWKKVTIRNQHTRWGSCSRKGNLNFNYRLVLLPPHLADYVVVHELCHLLEFNHSPNFWQMIARALPDYAACRRELKNNY